MAFAIRNLSVLAYANGFTLWHYKTCGEEQATVTAPSFFRDAGDMLASGDMVMVSAPDFGQILNIIGEGVTLRTASLN
jgi:hypothetical protein